MKTDPSNTNVIAIDPGYDRIGIAIFNAQGLAHSECFIPHSKVFTERLLEIKNHIQALIRMHTPSVLALETLFFSKNQKTALKVAEARGVICISALELGLRLYEYSPQAVKSAVTGSGNADKTSVIKMVELLQPLSSRKRLDDEFDAIALGIAHRAGFRLSPPLST